MSSNYTKVEIRKDILITLKKLAKYRGLNLQELLLSFITDAIDDYELMEIGYEDYVNSDD